MVRLLRGVELQKAYVARLKQMDHPGLLLMYSYHASGDCNAIRAGRYVEQFESFSQVCDNNGSATLLMGVLERSELDCQGFRPFYDDVASTRVPLPPASSDYPLLFLHKSGKLVFIGLESIARSPREVHPALQHLVERYFHLRLDTSRPRAEFHYG